MVRSRTPIFLVNVSVQRVLIASRETKLQMLHLNRNLQTEQALNGDIAMPERHYSSYPLRQRLVAHLHITRLDHSLKQVFILPGVIVALNIVHIAFSWLMIFNIVVGLSSATLIACSNYVLNEMLDAPFDRRHPTKCRRPAAAGMISPLFGYTQWILMMICGMALASFISIKFVLCVAVLWFMGCIYNIPPVRSKELPYVDVLSESINNPIRFCLGWYMIAVSVIPPLSLLLFYWMLGAYFMTLKRFSEYRQIGSPALAAAYRRSFHFYTEETLLNSSVFYAATAMLFFGAFVMRYHMELIFAFPSIAWLMTVYFALSFEPESAVQNPERLYHERRLMIPLVVCTVLLILLSVMHLPWLVTMFPKSTL